LKLNFPGANPRPVLEPFRPLDTRISYFRGADPASWRSAVPVWGGVRYIDLYPGLDLELSGESGELRWRLVDRESQQAASRPEVRLRVEGADGVSLDGDMIRAATALGEIRLPLLTAPGYGSAGRPSAHSLEAGSFEIAAPFASGPAEQSMEASSAPGSRLVYSTYLGGSGGEDTDDEGRSNAVDGKGAAYVTGYTQTADFPVTPGAFDPTTEAWADAFIAKIDPSGSRLVYATYLGGNDISQGNGIAVDTQGAAYVTGWTSAADFPTTTGSFDPDYNASDFSEAFVVKLNPAGTALGFATFLGGEEDEVGQAIALGKNGAVFVAGWTTSPDFPATLNAFDRACGTDGLCNADPYHLSDAFIAVLNRQGSALKYATFLGGAASENGNGIAVDLSSAVYVTGVTRSPDFPVTARAFDRTCGTDGRCNPDDYGEDAFVAKLNPAGSKLAYATFLGGGSREAGLNLAVDRSGHAYVTGSTASADFPVTAAAFDRTLSPGLDTFVAKLNQKGSGLVYATFLGGDDLDCSMGCDIAVNEQGEALVAGDSLSANFPTTANALDRDCSSGDAFLAKLSADGARLRYATCVGGSDYDGATALSLDASGSAYLTGWTGSLDFPITLGAYDRDYNGEKEDIFLVKLR
jgi:hypothetical protein